MTKKIAIIMGAGPAGLTAAYELLEQTDVQPIIFEQSNYLGGLSKTVDYKGNKIDIGGHRFFSKSDKVMKWWLNILPLYYEPNDKDSSISISYRNQSRNIHDFPSEIADPDKVMLLRNRKSRILFRGKLFDYPLKLNLKTIHKLGFFFTLSIFISYVKSQGSSKEEKTLEDFFIKRFGKKLYTTFFKDYTEKVWGVACKDIDASWGAQRIKGLSIGKAIAHSLTSVFVLNRDHKKIETSLIEKFLYPKYGPGQMWQEVGKRIVEKGGIIHTNSKVAGLKLRGNKIESITVLDNTSGIPKEISADYFISTMPVKELIHSIGDNVPREVVKVAEGLQYRDFITVGILLSKMQITDKSKKFLSDTWLYIQEKGLKMGRMQFFNNWSPYMVSEEDKIWIGLEYFCYEGDELWKKSEKEMSAFAVNELVMLNFIESKDVLDTVVIKEYKAYPSYTGTYANFTELRNFTDPISNLFLVGRNGMHRYNNQDHSMLTAMAAVENIKNGSMDKTGIWEINTEDNYLEDK